MSREKGKLVQIKHTQSNCLPNKTMMFLANQNKPKNTQDTEFTVDCEGCDIGDATQIGIAEEDFILFLQDHAVLLRNKMCSYCGSPCTRGPSRLEFRCQKVRIINGIRQKCNVKLSVKTHTWLKGSKFTAERTCKFILNWLIMPHPRHDLLKSIFKMADRTVCDWSNFCREVCINSLVMINDEMLGGPGKVVEIHEAKFRKRKNNLGREFEGSWVFGCLERETRRSFFVPVQDRSAATLMGVILNRILPGTTIMSDRWRGYDSLTNHPQYHHLTDNHGLNFIDPQTGDHTQRIERAWREVQNKIPRFGSVNHHLNGYLAEFYWKSKYPITERMHHFLLEISRQYPPDGN